MKQFRDRLTDWYWRWIITLYFGIYGYALGDKDIFKEIWSPDFFATTTALPTTDGTDEYENVQSEV